MLELLVRPVQRELQEPLGLLVCLLLDQQDQLVILETLEPRVIPVQLDLLAQALPALLVRPDRRAQRVLLVLKATLEPQLLVPQELLGQQDQPELLVPQVSQDSPLLDQQAHKVLLVIQVP